MPRGRTAVGRRWLHQLLASPGAGRPTPGRAWALQGAATTLIPVGGAVRHLLEESRAIARAVSDHALEAFVLATYGWSNADPAGPERHLEAVAVLLGYRALAAGDLDAAQARLERSRAIGAPVGDRWHGAVVARGLARLAGARGDAPGARRLFTRALALHHEIGDRLGEGDTLVWEGELATGVSDVPAARACFAGALRVYADIGALRPCPRPLEWLAFVAAAQGSDTRALRLAGAAAAIRERVRTPTAPDTRAADARTAVEQLRAAALRRLGPQAAAAAWAAGRALRFEEAIAEALDESLPGDRPQPPDSGRPVSPGRGGPA